MNPAKEIRSIQNGLHDAAAESETDQGFLGIIHNHVDAVNDDLKFIIHDVKEVMALDKNSAVNRLEQLQASIQVMERQITDTALSTEDGKKYQDQFTAMMKEFENIEAQIQAQIGTRDKLLSQISTKIDSFNRHEHVTRVAARRGMRFENRFGKNIKRALKAIKHLLEIEVSARINAIKNPVENKKAPYSRYYGKVSRVEAMKGRNKSGTSVFEMKYKN
jgi:hypothetical protein